ncbi:hypothetical protein [Wenzhouxiangella marina]|uniref:Uncharacterized protein n=1 Tax=Wenzhouxiangella marina TaxID=1579979 RepID=A0A0K0XTN7_9GAMM|nr:hypothetical protein [Wenzhouxiangella marina]AKS40987.1 hypothetical protein WM2015_605 [Wenzhouxiangella marina]MBB6087861.1 hypothetical protein [Wenzhouxiangella marina]
MLMMTRPDRPETPVRVSSRPVSLERDHRPFIGLVFVVLVSLVIDIMARVRASEKSD